MLSIPMSVLGGHVETNETPDVALAREVKEEIGVVPTKWSYLETIRTITDDYVLAET